MDQKRYKSKGLQFTSAADSRALRAIQHRADQKSRRDDTITRRRHIESLEDSVDEGRASLQRLNFSTLEEKPKKKTLEELGRERYQQLQIWKEQKKKKLEKEKQQRKPAFKTGIYQADTPKFLVSADGENLHKTVNNTPGRPTPFKFLVRSSKKSGVTPGVSAGKPLRFCTGVTPGIVARKIPTFRTGVTPDQTLQKSSILSRQDNKQIADEGSAKPAHRTRAALRAGRKGKTEAASKRGIRGRTSRSRRGETEDLGVKPLPKTPQALQRPLPGKASASPKPNKTESSFAPSDFTFEFNVQRALNLLKSCTADDDSEHEPSPPKRRQSKRSSIYNKKNVKPEVTVEKEESPVISHTSQVESDDAGSTGTYIVADQHIADLESVQESDAIINKKLEEHQTIPSETEEESDLPIEKVEENDCKPAEEDVGYECAPSHEEAGNVCEPTEEPENVEESAVVPAEIIKQEQSEESTVTEGRRSIKTAPEVVQQEFSEDKETVEECEAVNPSPVRAMSRRRSSRAKTPKRITRRSIACCGEGVSPTVSRLRPRTPCTRSTRRSLSAHCDSPVERMFTPLRQASARKSSRRSVGSALKQKAEHDICPDIPKFKLAEEEQEEMVTEPLESVEEAEEIPAVSAGAKAEKEGEDEAQVPASSVTPIVTPVNRGRRSRVSWMIETSPWVNDVRRSSQKKRRSGVPPDILALFDDIPTDGSPLPAYLTPEGLRQKELGASPELAKTPLPDTPQTVNSSIQEDQTCSNLLALLQPTANSEHVDSPDIDVWGEDSPAVEVTPANGVPFTPVSSKNTYSLISASPALQQLDIIKEQENAGILSDVNSSSKSNAGKRKSRRSVMFAVQDQENVTAGHFRFPGTPIRASSRVSMGLFSKVDTDTEVPMEGQDLMGFDSPQSEKKTAATRRKSSRISLLPGMETSPLVKDEAGSVVTQDLISWETPMENKRRSRRSAVSSFATPRRQSRRVSKVPVL